MITMLGSPGSAAMASAVAKPCKWVAYRFWAIWYHFLATRPRWESPRSFCASRIDRHLHEGEPLRRASLSVRDPGPGRWLLIRRPVCGEGQGRTTSPTREKGGRFGAWQRATAFQTRCVPISGAAVCARRTVSSPARSGCPLWSVCHFSFSLSCSSFLPFAGQLDVGVRIWGSAIPTASPYLTR